MKRRLIFFIVVFFLPLSVFAQRAVVGQSTVALGAAIADGFGADILLSHVSYSFPFRGGIHYRRISSESIEYSYKAAEAAGGSGDEGGVAVRKGTYETSCNDIYATAGLTKDVFSVRSRAFRLMLYGDAVVGARLHDRRDPERVTPKSKFIYGFDLGLDAEFFLYKGMSLYACYNPRLQLYGAGVQERHFFQDCGVGLRFYFFAD